MASDTVVQISPKVVTTKPAKGNTLITCARHCPAATSRQNIDVFVIKTTVIIFPNKKMHTLAQNCKCVPGLEEICLMHVQAGFPEG